MYRLFSTSELLNYSVRRTIFVKCQLVHSTLPKYLRESEQDFTNYFNSKLKAGFEKINAPMPKGEFYEVHNINAHQGINSYKFK
jgi:hypothetical protein